MNSPTQETKRPVLMVVDDHADVRLLLRLTLRHSEFQLREFADGVSALEAASREPPAVVLLDVMMPGRLDGLQVCRDMRARPELRDTRIIILSARAQATDIEIGIAAGADAYLTKPFSPVQLIHTVYRVLGRSVEELPPPASAA